MTREEILKEMGFTNIWGNEWGHPDFGQFHLSNSPSPKEVVAAVYERGQKDKVNAIKKVLDIK